MHQAHACGGRARVAVAVAVAVAVEHESTTTAVAAVASKNNSDNSNDSNGPEVIDMTSPTNSSTKPSSWMVKSSRASSSSKRSIDMTPAGMRRRRRRQKTCDVVDLSTEPDTPTAVSAAASTSTSRSALSTTEQQPPNDTPDEQQQQQWSCPQCTLLNPTLRPPDVTRTERLIDDDDALDDPVLGFLRNNNNYGSNNNNSTMLQSVGGGALIGSLMGGAASYMRGRSVADGMMEGAVSGAVVGGAMDAAWSSSSPSATATGRRRTEYQHQPTTTTTRHQQPRASVQVRRNRAADGRMVTTVVTSQRGSGRMQQLERPGEEPALRSLLMATMGGGGLMRGRQNIDGMEYEQLLQAFGDGTENMGADEQVIQSLPICKLQNVEKELPPGDARRCCICLDDFEVGETRKTLPCLHGFHSHCIDKALRNRGACPICNSSLKFD